MKNNDIFIKDILSQFQELSQNCKFEISKTISIASNNIEINFQNEKLFNIYFPAISHVELDSKTKKHDLKIQVFDNASQVNTKILLDKINSSAQELQKGNSSTLYLFKDDSNTVSFQVTEDNQIITINFFNKKENLAFVYIYAKQDLDYFKSMTTTAPFRNIFSWYFSSKEFHIFHAGAIGTRKSSIIIAGRSNLGKSSCCLRCLEDKINFIADDSVLISNDDSPKAYSLYNTASISPSDIQHFPLLNNASKNVLANKVRIYFSGELDKYLLKESFISAILIPHISYESNSKIEKLSATKALGVLVSANLAHLLASDTSKEFNATKSILEKVKNIYSLQIGEDVEQLKKLIKTIINDY